MKTIDRILIAGIALGAGIACIAIGLSYQSEPLAWLGAGLAWIAAPVMPHNARDRPS